MYIYDFKATDESIIKEVNNVNIKINENYYLSTFVLTEKNLLIFNDVNRGNPTWGAGTYSFPELHLLYSISLDELNYEKIEDNLFISTVNPIINCYDFDLNAFLN